MNAPRRHAVFVYGTLKRGGSNHACLAGQQFIGPARSVPGYTLVALGDYPGMIRQPDDSAGVTGELWRVDDAALAVLDELEGVAEGLYTRITLALQPPAGAASALAYLYARDIAGRPVIGETWPVDGSTG